LLRVVRFVQYEIFFVFFAILAESPSDRSCTGRTKLSGAGSLMLAHSRVALLWGHPVCVALVVRDRVTETMLDQYDAHQRTRRQSETPSFGTVVDTGSVLFYNVSIGKRKFPLIKFVNPTIKQTLVLLCTKQEKGICMTKNDPVQNSANENTEQPHLQLTTIVEEVLCVATQP
jgi:hypothetical protein